MPANAFEIDDNKSFDANLTGFIDALTASDPALAAVAQAELPKLLRGELDKTQFWDALYATTKPGEAP
jgi:hypothetical protein